MWQQKKKELLVRTKPSYNKTVFRELVNNRSKKGEVFMNRSAYLGLTNIDISKLEKYEFLYDVHKTKIWRRTKLCYMETDCFIDIVKVGERRLDTSN